MQNNNDNNIGKYDYILFLEKKKIKGKKERYKWYNVKRDEILRKKIYK